MNLANGFLQRDTYVTSSYHKNTERVIFKANECVLCGVIYFREKIKCVQFVFIRINQFKLNVITFHLIQLIQIDFDEAREYKS